MTPTKQTPPGASLWTQKSRLRLEQTPAGRHGGLGWSLLVGVGSHGVGGFGT
jgi:hypothetical protein